MRGVSEQGDGEKVLRDEERERRCVHLYTIL